MSIVYAIIGHLVVAIDKNSYDVVEWLITVYGANVNRGFIPPLFCAVCNNKVEIVKLLLDNGADTNVKNGCNQTPLDIAREYNCTEIIEILESPMIKSANKV